MSHRYFTSYVSYRYILYFLRAWRVDNDICPKCRAAPETLAHVLNAWPAKRRDDAGEALCHPAETGEDRLQRRR